MNEEKVLFRGSSSPVINLGAFVLGLLALGASVAAALFFEQPLIFIAAGVVLLFMLIKWLLIKTRVYEITTERVRVTEGILTRKTEELELYRVQDLTVIEPFVARLFGTGSILLTTMDPTTPNVEIEYIRGVRNVREELRKNIETCRERKRVRVAEFE
jgi:uncharacterized membrane protein YdbT with pleckstrin-like domain